MSDPAPFEGNNANNAGNCSPSCGAHGKCVDEGNATRCDCEAGYIGDACKDCAVGFVQDADRCIVRSCNANSCQNNRTCTDGTFGLNCDLSCSTVRADWAVDTAKHRQAFFLSNASNTSISKGFTTELTFDHEALLAKGSKIEGDLTLLALDGTQTLDVPYMLRPDSEFSMANTTLLIALPKDLAPNEALLVYMYFSDPEVLPGGPWSASEVLQGSSGWAVNVQRGLPLASRVLKEMPTSIQFRQTSPGAFDVVVHDASDDDAAFVSFSVLDSTGTTVARKSFSDELGGSQDKPVTFNERVMIEATDFSVTLSVRDRGGSTFFFGARSQTFAPGNELQEQTNTYRLESPLPTSTRTSEPCAIEDKP